MYVSVVLPCLNEAATVATCVRDALSGLEDAGLNGEVVVADNGSQDGSCDKAMDAGAKVVHCPEKGYGAALRCGISHARGEVIVMADADGTYDLLHTRSFLEPIASGAADMVMGNRLGGIILPGAMPWTHRYVGVPALTWVMNVLYGMQIGDAHCGIRSFSREAYNLMAPSTSGMEFASELLVRAGEIGLTIVETPTSLRPGPAGRVPHLRSLRDGWRHLRYLVGRRYFRRRETTDLRNRRQSSALHRSQNGPVDLESPVRMPSAHLSRNAGGNRVAFSLIELLVAIGIVGVLTAITLPALSSSREAARRTACANNLRQAGLAIGLHSESHGHFPTGGWNGDWLGDPDRGYGLDQPGGWIYNILPFIEAGSLRDLGKGTSGSARLRSQTSLTESLLEVLHCPSRRAVRTYPYRGPAQLRNARPAATVAKSDYAINEAISFSRSDVLISEAERQHGLSKLLIAAEKSVASDRYTSGDAIGDMLCMYVGDSVDIRRSTTESFTSDATDATGTRFGSPHPSVCNVAFGDGSVRSVEIGTGMTP